MISLIRPHALRLVLEWAGEHQDELRANWDRARAHDALVGSTWGPMAEPLRDQTHFSQVCVDPGIRTVVWPNGFDLDADVLHGRRSQDLAPAAPPQSAA